ncbi:putative FAD binding protein [Apiosordaria backusii]|uniref:FAD binding protein n=1 Tax=Apiosordaria backusii TaxID=314023 RepID=A0AA40ANG4_9PEZI|nr:putative FAD binding protein [Apiosordaria backusii]
MESLTTPNSILRRQHIQNFSEASELEPHWGYAYRVVPCTNDPGSCAYLDVVYESHDLGMLYTGIFWATVLGILLLWGIGRRPPPNDPPTKFPLPLLPRHHLLHPPPPPPHRPLKSIFGHTTRLQLLILAVLTSYLTIWSFVGIVYGKWVTPIKGQPAHIVNTRTSLGPWADRVGVLAYALTPLSVLFAARESILSSITGVPYTSFMFLHKWTGYIILAQSILHTLGWVLVEGWLYQPQPDVWNKWVAQEYAIWGFVALGLLILIWICSFQWVIKNVTGYEFFRKAHYVMAMVYIGALIGHWEELQCFLVPGIVLWVVDRGARLVRMGMLHSGYQRKEGRWGFSSATAEAKLWKDDRFGDVVRLDFDHAQSPWKIGQHFFLCFTEGSIWQSHPFTPLSLPQADQFGGVRHSYIFRAKGGETKKIAKVLEENLKEAKEGGKTTTNVVLQGPYGEDIAEGLTRDVNVLCVAGGTGITYVLPVLLRLARERMNTNRKMELVWAVKRRQDLEWVGAELEELRRLGAPHGLQVRIFVTAEENAGVTEVGTKAGDEKTEGDVDSKSVQSASAGSDQSQNQRPDVNVAVNEFVANVVQGPTQVFGSGPPSMITELREAVAQRNSGSKVWKGEERFDVRLVCDDRLEW